MACVFTYAFSNVSWQRKANSETRVTAQLMKNLSKYRRTDKEVFEGTLKITFCCLIEEFERTCSICR